jgi:Rrf2 family transcriptional regulator, iron-sulfur cluster assembly transcription factor
MKISTSSQYALMAVGYVATHPQDGNIMAKNIAKEYNIPFEYLLKILQSLARAGVLKSKRGIHGGFVMGKELDQITILDIVKAMEGDAPSQYYIVEQTKNVPFAAKMEHVCEKAAAEYNKILQATVAEMVGSSKK